MSTTVIDYILVLVLHDCSCDTLVHNTAIGLYIKASSAGIDRHRKILNMISSLAKLNRKEEEKNLIHTVQK